MASTGQARTGHLLPSTRAFSGTLSDISSVHWQPALKSLDVVEAEADIDQAIRVILGTPKGSDPHRPDFGSNIHL